MKLIDQLKTLETSSALVFDATPLQEPVNPWAWLAEQLAEQDIEGLPEEQVEALRQLLRRYRQFATGCEVRTQNRLLIYCLSELVMSQEALSMTLLELRRISAWWKAEAAPTPAKPTRRRLGDQEPPKGEEPAS